MKNFAFTITSVFFTVLLALAGSFIPDKTVQAAVSAPVVFTDFPSDGGRQHNYYSGITTNWITLHGRVIFDGVDNVRVGFRYRNRLFGSDTSLTSSCSFSLRVTYTVSDYNSESPSYEYQAFVTYDIGTETFIAYGNILKFTGGGFPQVRTDGASFSGNTLRFEGTAIRLDPSYPTGCGFEYGSTTSYGNTTSLQSFGTAQNWPYFAEVTDIEPGIYHYRAIADTGMGWSTYGEDKVVDYRLPHTVSADTATNITISSANLSGFVNSMGNSRSVSAYFEYGTTKEYGKTTPPQVLTTFGPFSAALNGLSAGTTYHYRAVADGGGNGKVYSEDYTFTTEALHVTVPTPPSATTTAPSSTPPVSTTTVSVTTVTPATPPPPATDFVKVPPLVNSGEALAVTPNSATLYGNLANAGNSPTNVYFEYGTTSSYGSSTPLQNMSDAGPFSALLTGLSPDTTYHFRAVAYNEGGNVKGTGISFTTASLPPATGTGFITTSSAATTATPAETASVTQNPLGPSRGSNYLLWAIIGFGVLAVLAVIMMALRSRKRRE